MAVVHKKYEAAKEEGSKKAASTEPKGGQKPEESKKESVVISDTVMETAERIEVIEEVTPESEEKTTIEPAPAANPLTDFKEKMTEEEQVSSFSPTKKNYMWPILFVVFLALAFLIGVFLYKQGTNKGTQVNVVTLSPSPTAIPEPTKTVDLSKYEIKILNGSEVEGEAGRQKNNLESEGFTVSSVGNAAKSDYTQTIIQAKKEVELGFLDKLKSALEKSFVVGETEELPEDADSDVIVILGSENN